MGIIFYSFDFKNNTDILFKFFDEGVFIYEQIRNVS